MRIATLQLDEVRDSLAKENQDLFAVEMPKMLAAAAEEERSSFVTSFAHECDQHAAQAKWYGLCGHGSICLFVCLRVCVSLATML
jgi:hypothetical protein